MRGRRGLALMFGAVAFLLLLILILIVVLQSNQATPPPPIVVPETELTPGEEGTPPADVPVVPGVAVRPDELIDVVVSEQTLLRGHQMTEGILKIDKRLPSEVGPNVITRLEDAVDLYARVPIFQGETLTTDSLVSDPRLVGHQDFGPSSLVPNGWLAMPVPLNRLSSIGYALQPGDSVDIMLSFVLLQMDEQFQTVLQNSAAFIVQLRDEEGDIVRVVFLLDPFGRFEQLPNNDIAHVYPREDQRPIAVSMVVQGARVIQVGPWTESPAAAAPTPTPDPNADTPEPGADQPVATPDPPDVLLVALPPQQALVVKWAVDSEAIIQFALRGVNDGQAYAVENVHLDYLLQRFNFDIPSDFTYTVLSAATPAAENQR
jgi:Flp pilus assembly protein CpaB